MFDMATQALDRGNPLPLWAQLEAELRRRMATGDLENRLPPELRLAEDYAVSRQTVREAVRRLQEAGLLRRERGRGTFVAARELVQPLGVVYSLFRNVEAQGVTQTSDVRVLERRRDAAVAGRLGVAADADLVYLERLRWADNTPLALDRVWMPAAVAAPLLDADFHHTALYDELARRCNVRVDDGWERLRAVVPSRPERELLALRPGAAAFAIERVGRAQGRLVEVRSTLVRGDRYSLVIEWSPSASYAVDIATDPAR
ncbi:MAG: GntR family transcriptional regulator [Candidatus Dormibacteria bacterium]